MASPKKFLVLAKIETTQFTDATPTAATDAILAKNLKVTPLRVESQDRALLRPYFGNSEQIPVMQEAVIEFDVEMAGSGAAGTAPKWGPLMQACGFAEVITPSVSAAYNPVSSAFKYATIYCYRDGVLYKLLGAHGSLSIDMAAKQIPHLKFKFVGKYTAVTDVAIPGSPVFTGFQLPKASIPTWTGTATFDSYASKLAAVSIDMATEISHAVWMNYETLEPTDRKPKGSLTVEAVTVATKNYFTLIEAASSHVFTLTHGTVAGNKVKIDAPKMQLADMSETEFSGSLAYQFSTTLNPSSGNDEIVITAL